MLRNLYTAFSTIALVGAPLVAIAQADRLTPVFQNVLTAVNTLVIIVFVIALLVFGWGIVKLIIAAGDPGKIAEAKGFILWGIIGIAILASLFGIITWLQNYFGVQGGTGTINVPTVTQPR